MNWGAAISLAFIAFLVSLAAASAHEAGAIKLRNALIALAIVHVLPIVVMLWLALIFGGGQ